MFKRLVQLLAFTLAYGAVAYATLSYGRQTDIAAAIWPAGALAFGVVIALRRDSIIPEIIALAIANAAAHMAVGDGPGVSALLGFANGVDLAAPFWLLQAAGVRRGSPNRIRSITCLFFVAITGPVPGALIGGLSLGLVRAEDLMAIVTSWWLVQSMGLLILTPPFLFWRSAAERKAEQKARHATAEAVRARRRRLIEIAAAGVTLTVAGFLVPLTGQTLLIQLSVTVLLWFALRFGMFATALTVSIYSACVLTSACFGIWPGVDASNLSSVLLPLQLTLALTTLPTLLVAATMSQRERARRELDQDARRLVYALEGANDGLWDCHLPSNELFLSVRDQRMLGYEPGEVSPEIADWRALVHPDDLSETMAAFEEHARGAKPLYEAEFRCRHKDGHWVWILDRGKIVERDVDGVAIRAVGTHTDISERKELERALEHLATHDSLTGLVNRGVFERGLIRAAARLDRQGGRVAVILIDLDHFKAVNDEHGHAAGDVLLSVTAARLRAAARADDLVARLGGDEFAVIASGQSAAEFDALAERFCKALSAPVAGGMFETEPSVSIGVAVATIGAKVGDDLVLRADRALYAAKNAGRGTWRFFGGAEKVA